MSVGAGIPTTDLAADIARLENVGFLLEVIYPADAPRVARLSGFGVHVCLDTESTDGALVFGLHSLPEPVRLSAGVELQPVDYIKGPVSFTHIEGTVPAADTFLASKFEDKLVHTAGGDWGVGRAGMYYRDLIPERHGGRVIASHIRIDEPGPVPDYVHHHDIRFQMIYCRRGRVEVVYEDQGEAFWMSEGDCVLQPPNIRHRVLASNDGLEVVEIASPAEHPTYIEHEMELPTGTIDIARNFGGQRFSFDRAADTPWIAAENGWQRRVTGIGRATGGIGFVQVLRGCVDTDPLRGSHEGDLCLFFVLSGSATLDCGDKTYELGIDDSVAVPRNVPWTLTARTDDLEVLHVEVSAKEEK